MKIKTDILSQGLTASWYLTALGLNLSQYDTAEKIGSSLFFPATQQLMALAGWNTYKFLQAAKIYFEESEEEYVARINTIKLTPTVFGAIVNANSYQVAILWAALLRNNIPFSLLFHVSPALISSANLYITGSTDANLRGCTDYSRKAIALGAYNAAAGLLTVVFTYAGLKNPDTQENSVYPGYTDWDTAPIPATITLLGVVLISAPLMPLIAHGIQKGLNSILTTCFRRKSTTAYNVDISNPKSANSDSPLSAILPTPTYAHSKSDKISPHTDFFITMNSPSLLDEKLLSTPSIPQINVSPDSLQRVEGDESPRITNPTVLSKIMNIFSGNRQKKATDSSIATTQNQI